MFSEDQNRFATDEELAFSDEHGGRLRNSIYDESSWRPVLMRTLGTASRVETTRYVWVCPSCRSLVFEDTEPMPDARMVHVKSLHASQPTDVHW